MLGGEEIHRRLSRGELMHQGTWVESNIRGASYDLRMASRRFVIVRNDGSFDRVDNDHDDPTGRVLRPGDFALVSSQELLTLSARVAGCVGAKFDFIRQGMLVLTGINVDPGFGLRDPQPLHFLLANMSNKDLTLTPHFTKIATIQFHDLGDTGGRFAAAPLSNAGLLNAQFFDQAEKPDLALDLFNNLSEVHQLKLASDRNTSVVDSMKAELDGLKGEVAGISQGANQIILFGVILLSATVSGVLATVLLQGGLFPNGRVQLSRLIGASAAMALFAAGTAIILRLLLWVGRKFTHK